MRRLPTETGVFPTLRPNRITAQSLILNNLGWLLGCLMLAFLVWYAAVSQRDPVQENRYPARVPIDIMMDDGLMLLSVQPANATTTSQVTIRTLQSTWNALINEDIHIFANLKNRQPGRYTVDLQGELLNGHNGAVTEITPRQITVELVARAERIKDIQIKTAQQPLVGFEVVSVLPEVNSAKISGPAPLVSQVVEIRADVSIQNQSSSFSKTVPLVALDDKGNSVTGLTLTPDQVTVNIDIQERKDVTGLQVIPSYVGELPAGYLLIRDKWDPRRIFVRGDEAAISKLNGAIPTEPIDLTGRTQTFTQRYRLKLPDGVTMPDPTDITVTVEIQPILVTREFVGIPVQPQGLDPADYSITVAPVQVNVRITGPQSAIEKLTEKDISVFALVSGLGGGQHTVNLEASVTAAEILRTGITIVPSDQASVIITALKPTPTFTPSPTLIVPSATPPEATLVVTPTAGG